MASVLTSDEMSNPTDGERGVTGAAGQAASVKATPKAAGAKPVRVRFSTDEKTILLKEVIASGGHIAGYGKKEKKFEETVEKINENPHFPVSVKTRAVQEKLNKNLKDFRKRDRKERKNVGVADDMSEADKLLSSIVDAVDDMHEAEDAEKGKATAAESRKRAAGDRVLAMANGESSSGDADGENRAEEENGEEEKEDNPGGRKRRRKTPVVVQMSDGLARFGESMKVVEVAKVDLQAKRLALEERCHEDLIRERAEQRRNDAEDRQKREEADMARLKAMLDFAVKSINSQQ